MHKKKHFYYGIIILISFLLTGQYMEIVHNRLVDYDGGTRMLFRANHIYFLLTGIMNLIFSLVENNDQDRVTYYLKGFISMILFIIPILILLGFFTEPFMNDFARPYTRPGIYLAMGIGVAIVLNHFRLLFKKKKHHSNT